MTDIRPLPSEAGKQALVDRLTAVRSDLLALLRSLPADRLTTPGAVGEWSARDVVGHLASWEDRLLTLAQMVINRQVDKIEWIGDDEALQAWNRKEYLRKQAWSWDETIRDLAMVREELLWNIGWATPEQLFEEHTLEAGVVSPAGLLEEVVDHDREHTAHLRAWAEGNS